MSRAGMLLCVAGTALSCSLASARPSDWNAGVSGLWTEGGRWNGGIPNGNAATAIIGLPGVYTVTMNVPVQLLGLSVGVPDVLVDIANGQSLTYYGSSLSNDGQIRVNSSQGGNSTSITFLDSCTIGPAVEGGWLTLNANAGNLDTAYLQTAAGKVLTNAATHTIRGTGNIYAPLVNNGIVLADVPGRTLQLFSTPKTNNSIMRATGGGNLVISDITVTQGPQGQIVTDTTNLWLNSVTISGGSVTALGNTRIVPNGALNLKDGVSITGLVDIPNGQSVIVNQPDLVSNGTITLNPAAGGSNTYMQFNQPGTIVGQTDIVLNANPGNLDTAYLMSQGGSTLTIPGTSTVRGTGNLYLPLVNNSVISADVNGRTLQFLGAAKVNNGTILATAGGRLLLNSITLTQGPAGLVTSDGTDLSLVGMTINGGSVTAGNGGHIVITANLALTGGVSTAGPLDIPNAQALTLHQPNLIHNGVVTVNTTAGGSNTYVLFTQSGTIVGPAQIFLNANPGNLDTAYIQGASGATLTLPATATIRGTGNLYVPLINNGLVHANVSGRTIQLLGGAKTNNATIKATGGGLLRLDSITLNQGASGLLTSDQTDLSLVGATLSGGTCTVTGGARMVVTGNLSLTGGVSTAGPLDIPNAQAITLNQANLIHSGVVTVNTGAGGSNTSMLFTQSGTIVGPTEIVLNANPGNLDTAYLHGASGVTLTLPSTATIRGTGNLYVPLINNGLVHANVNGRTIQLLGGAKTNNATIKASGGGLLQVNEITLNQGASGQIISEGTNLSLVGCEIRGGQMEVTGGVIQVIGSVTLSGGVNYFGSLNIPNSQGMVINQPATLHSGVTMINQTAGGSLTPMRFTQASSIDGGELLLNANPANLDTAYLQAQSGALTLGGQETLRGRGRLYGTFVNNGTTSVGMAPGAVALIDCQGAYTTGPDSVLEVDVGGTDGSQFDRITCSGSVTVGGTIRVRLTGGYVPIGGGNV